MRERLDETDVEVCLELARMYDTEDLTHPPFRTEQDMAAEDAEDLEVFKERDNEPMIDFEAFITHPEGEENT